MVLAKAKDLALLLDLQEQDPRVALALRRASDAFAGAVHYPVSRVVDDEVLLRGDGSQELFLPGRPVESATVQLPDGETVVASVAPGSDVVLDARLGVLTRPAGWPHGPLLVTFTHGWPQDEIPGDIQDAVLEKAHQVAHTLGFIKSETTGPFNTQYEGVTQKWVDTAARYRIGVGDRS